MLNNNIQYPFAFDFKSEKLVHINELTLENKKELKNNLICKDCKEPFVAVIQHSTPHFKHSSNSECSGTKESYIHWVSKEIFRNEEKIYLPPITIDDLPEKERQKFQLIYNNTVDKNIPQEFRFHFKKKLKRNLTQKLELEVKYVELEKEFNSKNGNIKVDIVLVLLDKNKTLFIEPFYTNRISRQKLEKIKLIDITTFSIDLKSYLDKNLIIFSNKTLRNYLMAPENKKIEHINSKDFDIIIQQYNEYLKFRIDRF